MERKSILLGIVSLLFVFILVGCVSRHIIGTPINESKLNDIKIGVTTKTKILELFGTPFKTESQNDGQSLLYVYAESFVRTTGVYNTRRDTADILNVLINSDGIVTDYSFSKGVPIPEDIDIDIVVPVI